MKVKGMGISLPPTDTIGDLNKLESKLIKAQELGFDAIEISIHGMDVIQNGVINSSRLNAYVRLFQQYSFRYTTHAPYDLNILRKDNQRTEKALLFASLEISGAIGAKTMVYHVGRYVGEEQFLHPHSWVEYSQKEKINLLQLEQLWMNEAGDCARQLNLQIGMENMRPYLDCYDYCYAVIPSMLVKQVEAINHSHVGIVLDTGHLYLSHKLYGLDFLDELEQMTPYIIHMHVHDNFGKACFSTEKNQYDLVPLGRGDMHAPIGYGDIPMASIIRTISNSFEGIVIHETRDKYENEWPTYHQRFQTVCDMAGVVINPNNHVLLQRGV